MVRKVVTPAATSRDGLVRLASSLNSFSSMEQSFRPWETVARAGIIHRVSGKIIVNLRSFMVLWHCSSLESWTQQLTLSSPPQALSQRRQQLSSSLCSIWRSAATEVNSRAKENAATARVRAMVAGCVAGVRQVDFLVCGAKHSESAALSTFFRMDLIEHLMKFDSDVRATPPGFSAGSSSRTKRVDYWMNFATVSARLASLVAGMAEARTMHHCSVMQ